jgi:hypothetical protein
MVRRPGRAGFGIALPGTLGGIMFESIAASLPEQWRIVFELITALISWIPGAQAVAFEFAFFAGSRLGTLSARVFLFLPTLLVIVAIWSTMLALYTIPFALMDWLGRRYFKPGVPWIAFMLTVAWCALEALIFTFTLMPTVSEVFYDLAGIEAQHIMAPILFIFLFVVISGSFASIQVLTEAWAKRQVKPIVQMLFVEFFVMFFEVVFLYRELIDAITPWIAANTGMQLGFASTLALACFGWIGIRAMTWFLFGRYGTPALLAVMAREEMSLEVATVGPPGTLKPDWWRGPIEALKREQDWFRARSRELLELLSLPVLQLLATAVNCATVVITGRPAFDLPFTSLSQVMAKDVLVQALKRRVSYAGQP